MKGLILNEKGIKIAKGNEYYSARTERLLFTPEDGVLGYPDWGSRIPSEYLMEPGDETLANNMINEVGFLFGNRESEIFLDSIGINILGIDSGQTGLAMELGVSIPSEEEEEQTIKFFKIVEI